MKSKSGIDLFKAYNKLYYRLNSITKKLKSTKVRADNFAEKEKLKQKVDLFKKKRSFLVSEKF